MRFRFHNAAGENRLGVFFSQLGVATIGRSILLGGVVGVIAGLAAVAFTVILHACQEAFLGEIAGWNPHFEPGGGIDFWYKPERPWTLFFLPALGGLVAGFLVYKFAPTAEGHGTDAVIRSYHRERGRIGLSVPLVKLAATSFSIGTGGSAGKEGPIAQISAGISSWLAGLMRVSESERRVLVLAGMGAGIGATFQAPLGGALFAVESLYREPEFEYEALIPGIIASTASYSTFSLIAQTYGGISANPWGSIFHIQPVVFQRPLFLLYFGILAVLLAAAGVLYIKTFYGMRKWFSQLGLAPWLTPAVGGLMLGVLAYFFPAVLETSYVWLTAALNGQITGMSGFWFLLLLAFLKIVATSLSISSGGSGGVFAPSLVIGGALGGAFGLLLMAGLESLQVPAYYIPNDITPFVLVGMAGFFTGAAKVPIATVIMVSEMTAGYQLLVPLMLVVAIAYLVTSTNVTLYKEQVARRIDSPAHLGDFIIDLLESMTVAENMTPRDTVVTVRHNLRMREIFDITTRSTQTVYPVLDADDEFMGVVTLDLIRAYYYEPEVGQLLIAEDICQAVDPVTPDDNLNTVLRSILEAGIDEYPVVESTDSHHLVGLVSRQAVMQAYHRRMQDLSRTRTSTT